MDFSRFFNEVLPNLSAFLGVFFIVMMIGYGFLYMIDFVPEAETEKMEVKNDAPVTENTGVSQVEPLKVEKPVAQINNSDPLPKTLHIPSLGRSVNVLNPNSRAVADLDAALLKGVVRHPDSADFHDGKGNILILGHSSYLKTVFNKNFQAFNGIQNLEWGDQIVLRSTDTEYTYRVDRVYEAKASNVVIPTQSTEAKLTLATCDTYGAKEDRFIVEATLISKRAL